MNSCNKDTPHCLPVILDSSGSVSSVSQVFTYIVMDLRKQLEYKVYLN